MPRKTIIDYIKEDPELYYRIRNYVREGIKKGRIKGRKDILKELDLVFGTNMGKGVLDNLDVKTLNKLLKDRTIRKKLPDSDFITKTSKSGKTRKYVKLFQAKSFRQQERDYKKEQKRLDKEAREAQRRLTELPRLKRPRTEWTKKLEFAVKARKGKTNREIAIELNRLYDTNLTANAIRLKRERLAGKRK